MNKFCKIAFTSAALWLLPSAAAADDSQQQLRHNPQIENDVEQPALDYSNYRFLNLDKNHIQLNGDDWSRLADKFKAAARGDSLFTVVYLGDSHIQADFGGAVVRRRLTDASRYAGRGLVIPFKLASTNQPFDYHFRMSSEYMASKLMKTPWSTEMCFSGIGLQPLTHTFSLDIGQDDGFTMMRFHTRGTVPEIKSLHADGSPCIPVRFDSLTSMANVQLPQTAQAVTVNFKSDATTVFGGVELLSDTVGTLVHSIGNNGATFSAYSMIDRFGSGLAQLNPDLVIIALGTNEAFGRVDAEALSINIENLVKSIRSRSPQAKILLVGPAECYRKTYRRVRRKGRRSRRVASTVVNTKVASVARTIRLFAEESGLPYYNHYAIAGGAGAAAKMRAAKVLGGDGIHYSAPGYRLWGNLLSDALLEELGK